MVYRLRLTSPRRAASWSLALGLLGLAALPLSELAAQAAKPPVTKADSAKAKAAAAKAPAKAAPTKASTTTAKPASTKPSTTTAKPASAKTSTAKPASAKTSTAKPATTRPSTTTTKPAPAKTSTDAKAAPTPATTDAKPATSPVTPAPTRAVAPAPTRAGTNADATGGQRPRVESYSQFGLYAGGATAAGLGFGAGPSGGIVWRLKSASLPFVFRADLSASRFTQQPLTNAGIVAGDASLLHAGAAVGFELMPGSASQSLRPYLTVSGGIYRFQGSGPAGTNTDIVDGVFATTNDVALLAGAGLRMGQRLFLEARFVTVGDFQSIPVVIGVHF